MLRQNNKKSLLFGFVGAVFCAVVMSNNCFAGSSNSTNVKSGWTQKNSNLTWDMPNDYLIAGCSGSSLSSQCTGTYSDEGAIVFNMARKFNDRGGYFCPTQVQVGNENKKQKTWMNFYEPVDAASCKWLCIDGYKGENCAETDSGDDVGNTSLLTLKQGSARKSGGSSNRVSTTIDLFAIKEHGYSDKRDAYVEVLAILKYLEHGVLVGHLWVYGNRDWGGTKWGSNNGSDIKSWVSKAHGEKDNSKEQILCDKGYKVNAAKTDCELMKEAVPPKTYCTGWTESEYLANETEFEYKQVGGCYQYRCADPNKAFRAETRICEDCSTGIRGGGSRTTGVCKRCEFGEYFDQDADTCKPATGYSRTDLQYGPGKNKTLKIDEQCWTKTDPSDYKGCVRGTKTTGNGDGAGSLTGNGGYLLDKIPRLRTLPNVGYMALDSDVAKKKQN